jgi:hypothetical protein
VKIVVKEVYLYGEFSTEKRDLLFLLLAGCYGRIAEFAQRVRNMEERRSSTDDTA